MDWINLQNQIIINNYQPNQVDWEGNPIPYAGYDPHNIDLEDRSTWPSIENTFLDPSGNQPDFVKKNFPWLPDYTTEEGLSAIYNLNRVAMDKFSDQAYMPNLYWLLDPEGKGTSYPYKLKH